MSDLRRQQRSDPAGDRGNHVEPHRHQVGPRDGTDAEGDEQHRKVESERRELAAWAETRDITEQAGAPRGSGPCGDRPGRHSSAVWERSGQGDIKTKVTRKG